MMKDFSKKRNYVLVGESGCGKTEVSIYLAKRIKSEIDLSVSLIDMDQTKGMFRSRDFKACLEQEGITVAAGPHFMDMPVVPHGMERLLCEKEGIHILDVGGNEMGAITMGQFSPLLQNPDTVVLYLINPYRNFSGTTENIRMLLEGIQRAGRLEEVHVVANPNLGQGTTEEDILKGYDTLQELLKPMGISPEVLVLPDWVSVEILSHIELLKWVISPYISYP